MYAASGNKILTFIFANRSKSLNILSVRFQSDYSNYEKSNYMKKLLNRSARTKKKWYQAHLGEPHEVMSMFSKGKLGKNQPSETNRTRARQLSHVLYDRISELINSDELSSDIANKQVLITSVKMLNDFSSINVYWDCNRVDSAEIENLLQLNSGKLRSLLISYHVLGRIPPITFVKDKSFVDLSLLNQLFEVADYGPDYVPSTFQKPDINSRSEIVEVTNAASATPANIHPSDNSSIDKSSKAEDSPTPTLENSISSIPLDLGFRSDIYGLPRDQLIKKVIAQKTKVRFQEPVSQNDLDMKELNILRDKLKIKVESSSKSVKQKLLESDFIEYHLNKES